MKKISAIICFLITSTAILAQKKITWGLHAGINISGVTYKNYGINFTTKSKAGFNGGIDVQLPVSSSIIIQPELSFSQLGGKISYLANNIIGNLMENYLSLPILVKYKVQNTGLGIYMGPQYNYLLNANTSTNSTSAATKNNYKRSDLAGIFGAEYYFPCNFGISARYQVGLLNISKIEGDGGETVKNHGFTFTVGYRF